MSVIMMYFQSVVNPCDSNPCQYGGKCKADIKSCSYTCDCPDACHRGPECSQGERNLHAHKSEAYKCNGSHCCYVVYINAI